MGAGSGKDIQTAIHVQLENYKKKQTQEILENVIKNLINLIKNFILYFWKKSNKKKKNTEQTIILFSFSLYNCIMKW